MNTKKLRNKIDNFLKVTENGMLKTSGKKLSVADCHDLLLYCDAIDTNSTSRLRKPLGNIAYVLDDNGLNYWQNSQWW